MLDRLRRRWRARRGTPVSFSATLDEAVLEALQYRPWEGPVVGGLAPLDRLTLAEWRTPPPGERLLIATYDHANARHVIQARRLNGAQVKVLRYPWQLDTETANRVVILADAYRLERWGELIERFADSTLGFVLLDA